jgi:MFS family permease
MLVAHYETNCFLNWTHYKTRKHFLKGMDVPEATIAADWRALLAPRLVLTLCVLLGGVLLHSMNVLIMATLLPSVVAELGGANLMSWPTTAFVASSIIAASGTSLVGGRLGNRRAFSAAAVIYAVGAVLCACAPSIDFLIAGRFVQGLGGGLLSALAYVFVRNVFPEALWPRVFGLLAGVWSVTVLIGPLIGGVFASYGHWRNAFVAVMAIGCLLSAGALFTLPADKESAQGGQPDFSGEPCCLDLRRDRAVVGGERCGWPDDQGHAHHRSCHGIRWDDADRSTSSRPAPAERCVFLRSPTGAGLWMVLLMSVGYSPLAIYAPLFLQRLHGLSPLGAGYIVALASLAWTTAALAVASLSEEWPPRLIVVGPLAMGTGLAGVGLLMAPGPVAALILPIVLIGIGIGSAWAFVLQRVMSGAKGGEENIAAASAATVQQAGIALGAAIAGLVANASGLNNGLDPGSVLRASLWVPLALVAAPLAACAIGVRLNLIVPRSPEQDLPAARND